MKQLKNFINISIKDFVFLFSLCASMLMSYLQKLEFNRQVKNFKADLETNVNLLTRNLQTHTDNINTNFRLHADSIKESFRDKSDSIKETFSDKSDLLTEKLSVVSENISGKVDTLKYFSFNTNSVDSEFALKVVVTVVILFGSWYVTHYYVIPYYKSIFSFSLTKFFSQKIPKIQGLV